jgi:hypothetical protein
VPARIEKESSTARTRRVSLAEAEDLRMKGLAKTRARRMTSRARKENRSR